MKYEWNGRKFKTLKAVRTAIAEELVHYLVDGDFGPVYKDDAPAAIQVTVQVLDFLDN